MPSSQKRQQLLRLKEESEDVPARRVGVRRSIVTVTRPSYLAHLCVSARDAQILLLGMSM